MIIRMWRCCGYQQLLLQGLWVLVVVAGMLLGGAECKTKNRSNNYGVPLTSVLVEVDASAPIATTDQVFLCATLDWWPPDKCDYGTCSWGTDSILNIDLTNPLLEKTLTELAPLRIRLGGTLQDKVVYDVGNPVQPCLPIVLNSSAMLGFQGGCLTMERWTELNNLFSRTGTILAFGLNAMYNRKQVAPGVWGPWDSSNALAFIQYTVAQGFQQVQAWEFGNELTSYGVGTSISAQQYAEDAIELRRVINSLYPADVPRPLLVAPDGFFEPVWFSAFLNASGPGVVDAVTRHIYNLGPGVSNDLVSEILNPTILDNELWNFQSVKNILQTVAPWAAAWVGEAGGAFNSGHALVTDAFVFSFWYLDELGMAASFDTKVYCRQTFIGGNYGLLNTTTFKPNPDYYSALLWNRLMGSTVLATKVAGAPYLRAYTHCQKDTTTGGVTVLLINLSNTTVNVNVGITAGTSNNEQDVSASREGIFFSMARVHTPSTPTRLEYHMTAPAQNLQSQTVLLNGVELGLTPLGELPTLSPLATDNSTPISVAPFSIAFAVLPNAGVLACGTMAP
jgi:heparanase 1